jgi:hypothetical protein
MMQAQMRMVSQRAAADVGYGKKITEECEKGRLRNKAAAGKGTLMVDLAKHISVVRASTPP